MIARLVLWAVVVAGLAGGGYALLSGDDLPRYDVVFDNAFGLTEGADVRAAGVRIGSVDGLDVDERTARAVVTMLIEKPSFGDLRTDVQCSIEPQSLIGEYFIDCHPGRADERLEPGARIPVEQTTGTIPPDLINNILRRPWRERFGIILTELGAGLAARGPELESTIRRAIPALRETDRVLEILADNRERLRSLTREADTVLGRLSERREDVARFVVEARDTAVATAERREDLATDIRLLPDFLRRLRPVLAELETTATRQTPALRNLRAAADDLELVFERLEPFSEAAIPALRSLGDASETGIDAMRAVAPTARELRELGTLGGDPTRNLRFILDHVDDRDYAVEPNPLSPGGKGFTGLEAFLQYPFVQSQAINIFDARGYLLKLNILPTPCSAYADEETVRENPELREQCSAALGPGPAYGIDDGASQDGRSGRRARPRRPAGERRPRREPADRPKQTEGDEPPSRPGPAPERPDGPLDVLDELPELLRDLPQNPPALPRDGVPLLDYLLGP